MVRAAGIEGPIYVGSGATAETLPELLAIADGAIVGTAAKVDGVEIFHAGTIMKDGVVLANGGRVLNICASGKTVAEAQARAYQAVDRINWPDGFCRRDIAWQAVEQERQ